MIQQIITSHCNECNSVNIEKNGTDYKGSKKVWKLLFTVDQTSPFGNNNEGLMADIDNVPFVDNLDNNAALHSVFDCIAIETKNTVVELVSE